MNNIERQESRVCPSRIYGDVCGDILYSELGKVNIKNLIRRIIKGAAKNAESDKESITNRHEDGLYFEIDETARIEIRVFREIK